ncbi:MAG: cobalt transporter CbiM [Rhodospirillaceae bacterium]|nr:cobalt transporter CbiM [Rhodospirillaceae bacterium]
MPDGILSAPVLIAGGTVALAGIAWALRRLDADDIPRTALVTAAFFVAALIHFPVGPTSVHLILNGLTGIMLSWTAFPAIAIALLLQAVLFGFGGIVTLGVNITVMAVPAVLCGCLFQGLRPRLSARALTLAGGILGALGVLLTALFVAGALALSGREFLPAAKLALLAHLPVMVIEAAVSAAAVAFLGRVRPELLTGIKTGHA